MTRTRLFRSRSSEEKEEEEEEQRQHYSKHNITSSTGMRVIVPLQGVVQGRGGLFLGSVIPCALFYFFQLYLKRHRSQPNPPPPQPPPENSEGQLAEVSVSALPRSLSRVHLSPRSPGGPAYVSGRANSIVKGGDSPHDVGLRKALEDPYHQSGNPDGVIQLGLAENKVGFAFFFGFISMIAWKIQYCFL